MGVLGELLYYRGRPRDEIGAKPLFHFRRYWLKRNILILRGSYLLGAMKTISLQRIAEINSTSRNSKISKAHRKLEKLAEDAKSIKARLTKLKEDYNTIRQKLMDEKGGAFYASARVIVQEIQENGVADGCEITKKAEGRLEKSYVSGILKLQALASAINWREEKIERIREKYGAQLKRISQLQRP